MQIIEDTDLNDFKTSAAKLYKLPTEFPSADFIIVTKLEEEQATQGTKLIEEATQHKKPKKSISFVDIKNGTNAFDDIDIDKMVTDKIFEHYFQKHLFVNEGCQRWTTTTTMTHMVVPKNCKKLCS